MAFGLSYRDLAILIFALLPLIYVSRYHCSRPVNCSPPIDCSRPVRKIVIEKPSECRVASVFHCENCIPDPLETVTSTRDYNGSWIFSTHRDGNNFGLTDEQCSLAFPGLFEDISKSIQRRKDFPFPITKDDLVPARGHKPTYRAMVYDNELYVIDHPTTETRRIRYKATLQAIHRAIISSPEPLPNVEFTVSVDDFTDADRSLWSYTRTADDRDIWLMPDFGFWSWGELGMPAAIGSWTQVQRRMREVEEGYRSFSAKIPKAFWRGEIALAEDIRSKLVEKNAGKPWADIKPTSLWIEDDEKSKEDALPIHEFCKYQFLIHTEGISYSGRLKYLQSCRSVVFAHTLQWIQPFEYLMIASGPKQNFVEVKRDFSDLASKVEYYLAHPTEAERIANNSVATFRDKYLTPAADACYWRKLLRGWREVSFEPEFYDYERQMSDKLWRGTPFETYALRSKLDFEKKNPGRR